VSQGAKLSFYGGVEEIGGNKLLLETGRTRVFLDFGLSFGKFGEYFSEFLRPRRLNGMGDFWALGLMPEMEGVYRNDFLTHMGKAKQPRAIDGVIISHAHMDHIGDIPFLRHDIPVLASEQSFGIMRALEETQSSGPTEYLTLFPAFQVGVGANGQPKKLRSGDAGMEPLERETLPFGANEASVGDVKVRGVDEDHSLPGANGILVEAATSRIAYTGDFRFHGRHGKKSWAFVEAARAFEPDVLLIEGTRVNQDVGTSEADVARMVQAEVEATTGLVVVNWPVRDTDRLLTFFEATKRAQRKLCISTKQAFVLQQLKEAGEQELPSLDDPNLRIFVPRKGWGLWGRPSVDRDFALSDYKKWERVLIDAPNSVTAEDIREAPRDYVVRVDFFELTALIDLQPPPGSRYIRSVTEPFNEEMEIDKWRADNWLKLFGLYPYKQAHASGHASGPELWKAIAQMAPRSVVPIHTEHHELFEKALEPLGIAVRKPTHMLKGGMPMELGR
jgi:ribonuclease J